MNIQEDSEPSSSAKRVLSQQFCYLGALKREELNGDKADWLMTAIFSKEKGKAKNKSLKKAIKKKPNSYPIRGK